MRNEKRKAVINGVASEWDLANNSLLRISIESTAIHYLRQQHEWWIVSMILKFTSNANFCSDVASDKIVQKQ